MSKHGLFIYEEGTALTVPVTGSAGIQVVIGTAPVNMAEDPSAVVNTPILANSATEAKQQLGYSTDLKKFTLCQTMYATSNIYQVSPVVYINVLDPAKHKKALAAREVAVSEMQAIVEQEGILKKGLTVSIPPEVDMEIGDDDEITTFDATDLTLGVDYTLDFNADGHLVITLIAGGAAAMATKLIVSGYQLDPDAITKNDIVGSYDPSTGKETGLGVIRQVYPKLSVVPGLLLAPGWSQVPEVGIALSAKAANINGVFKAMALIDLDTERAKKYTDCKEVKENSGFNSEFSAILWPSFKVGEYIFAASAIVGALTSYTDATNDDVPSISPSNKLLGVTGTCLYDGTEVMLDQDQGSTVNTFGITTAINMNGFRLWGNYTAAYPSSGDAKDIWFPVRRMFNWQGNNFILTYFTKVDDPMNSVLIESVVDSENIRCAAYAPDKWAGASIEYLTEDNPTTDILAGKMTFRQHIAPYTPAQEIDNILNYDTETLAAAITG